MRIELQIDQLTLYGAHPDDGPAILAAVERELARLAAVHGLPPALLEGGAALDGGRLRVTPGASVERMGSEIAGQLMAQWRPGTRQGDGERDPAAATADSGRSGSRLGPVDPGGGKL